MHRLHRFSSPLLLGWTEATEDAWFCSMLALACSPCSVIEHVLCAAATSSWGLLFLQPKARLEAGTKSLGVCPCSSPQMLLRVRLKQLWLCSPSSPSLVWDSGDNGKFSLHSSGISGKDLALSRQQGSVMCLGEGNLVMEACWGEETPYVGGQTPSLIEGRRVGRARHWGWVTVADCAG